MSLITLTSAENAKPYLYNSFFPQPIKIEAGSQVCVLKFIHYRNDETFLVNNLNNTLYFCLGNTNFDGKRKVVLAEGSYTGADLAAEIAEKMNDVCQQQNYEWSCAYSEINDSFTISYASVLPPDSKGGEWSDYIGNSNVQEIINRDNDTEVSEVISKIVDGGVATAFMKRGVLLHDGTYRVSSIHPIYKEVVPTEPSFNNVTVGLIRDVLSVPSPPQSTLNTQFRPDFQDVRVDFTEDGEIEIYSIDQSTRAKLGDPNYVSKRLMRTIPKNAITAIAQIDWTDPTVVVNLRFRIETILLGGTSSRIICRLLASVDQGKVYTQVTSPVNDPNGNPYFENFDSFTSCIWVSDNANFNDDGKEKQRVFITKRAPYVPTLTTFEEQLRFEYPSLLSGDSQRWTSNGGADTFDFAPYSGSNPEFIYTVTAGGGASLNRYFRAPQLSVDGSILIFRFSFTDNPAAAVNTAEFDISTGDLSITFDPPGTTTWTYDGTVVPSLRSTTPAYALSGIFNREDRPVQAISNQKAKSHVPFDQLDDELTVGLVGAAGPLSKPSVLYLRKITRDDVQQYNGSPAFLKYGEPSGNIGQLIGSHVNIVVEPTSQGQDVFTSDTTPLKVGKASTLHISVPELPVRSYEGGYNGIGKNIAVLPREEFKSQGSASGRLVYVSDFENWIDIDSATDLYVNQFNVEVRNPDGSLANDLVPDTSLQIKIRKNPEKDNKLDKLVSLLSNSMQRTGQILSQEINQTGS